MKDGLVAASREVRREKDVCETRLPIDRSFSIKGFGAVVTGTLASGEIAEGDELELLPGGRRLRVRGIQTYGKAVSSAHAGQRTAVNLGGGSHAEIERGMVLSKPGALAVTQVFDAEVEVLNDASRGLRSRQRIRMHLGTTEVLARVAVLNETQSIEPGSRGFAQFRLESPVAAAYGDRFIIRSYSPQRTIAGGRVLDPLAHKYRRGDLKSVVSRLDELIAVSKGTGNVAEIFVRMSGVKGLRIGDLQSRTALRADVLKDLIDLATAKSKLVDANRVLIATQFFESLEKATLDTVETHHRTDKLSRGLPQETLREQVFKRVEPEVFRAVTSSLERAGKIAIEQDVIKGASHETQLSPAEKEVHDRLRDIYATAGLEAPKLEDALRQVSNGSGLDQTSARKIFQLLVNRGDVVAVTSEYYFPRTALDRLKSELRDLARSSGDSTIDVPKFKEIAGVSRKYAIPLLEYFDRTHVTARVGDKRKIL
jgi:selenocysteine-specific elongation factor